MTEVCAVFVDGQHSCTQNAKLYRLSAEELKVCLPSRNFTVCIADLRVSQALAAVKPTLYFPDGQVCYLESIEDLRLLLGHQTTGGVIYFLENHSLALLGVLMVVVLLFWGSIQYAVPWGAKEVALRLPDDIDRSLGEHTLSLLEASVLEPSELTEQEQTAVLDYMETLVGQEELEYRILFRASKYFGANALAIGARTIVVTDELVRVMASVEHVVAVLAHEIGHVEQRHLLRQILQNSISSLLLVSLTGDVSSLEALAAALPTLMLQLQYSRIFEEEADAFAVDWLHSKGLSPSLLGEALATLEEYYGQDLEQEGGFFSTHPATKQRLESLQSY